MCHCQCTTISCSLTNSLFFDILFFLFHSFNIILTHSSMGINLSCFAFTITIGTLLLHINLNQFSYGVEMYDSFLYLKKPNHNENVYGKLTQIRQIDDNYIRRDDILRFIFFLTIWNQTNLNCITFYVAFVCSFVGSNNKLKQKKIEETAKRT